MAYWRVKVPQERQSHRSTWNLCSFVYSFKGTKVPRSQGSTKRKFPGATVQQLELSLLGTNGLWSESKAPE